MLLTANLSTSRPPLIENVMLLDGSASVAVRIVTSLPFSSCAKRPREVMTGGVLNIGVSVITSFWLVSVIEPWLLVPLDWLSSKLAFLAYRLVVSIRASPFPVPWVSKGRVFGPGVLGND